VGLQSSPRFKEEILWHDDKKSNDGGVPASASRSRVILKRDIGQKETRCVIEMSWSFISVNCGARMQPLKWRIGKDEPSQRQILTYSGSGAYGTLLFEYLIKLFIELAFEVLESMKIREDESYGSALVPPPGREDYVFRGESAGIREPYWKMENGSNVNPYPS
jgi:hypothetical protein